MTRQRQILVTVTYNDLGCIIDTKAEPYEEPNLQQTCNNFATDTISRQAAIDNLKRHLNETDVPDSYPGIFNAIEEWLSDWEVPSAKPDSKESSLTQRALDNDSSSVQSKQLQVLADVLDGCPLTQPCDKIWKSEGWCKEHCKPGQQEPDAECWLKYAEVMASEQKDNSEVES